MNFTPDIYTKLDTNPNTDPNYNYNIIIDEINQEIGRASCRERV